MAGERTLVSGFEAEFNDDHTWCEHHVLHQVVVSREGSDKWPNELIADGFLPLHEHAGNLKHHIFRVVGHNAILVRSSPRSVVLVDKGSDVNSRPDRSRTGHVGTPIGGNHEAKAHTGGVQTGGATTPMECSFGNVLLESWVALERILMEARPRETVHLPSGYRNRVPAAYHRR